MLPRLLQVRPPHDHFDRVAAGFSVADSVRVVVVAGAAGPGDRAGALGHAGAAVAEARKDAGRRAGVPTGASGRNSRARAYSPPPTQPTVQPCNLLAHCAHLNLVIAPQRRRSGGGVALL